MKDTIILYHKDCADGFGAAYAAWKYFGDKADYIPVSYGDELPDLTGKDVYMLDFSCKLEVAEAILGIARTLTIIDHHKSAYESLQDLVDGGIVDGIFDMNKSGAVLAWEWFHGNDSVPDLLLHVQDYDLWQFKLSHTREIIAAIGSYDFSFVMWDEWVTHYEAERESLFVVSGLIKEGKAILRAHNIRVNDVVKNARKVGICGWEVPCVNANGFLANDVGAMLAKDEPFSATYYVDAEGRNKVSLRSDENQMDVSEIAKQMGGGGHKHAAGYITKKSFWEVGAG